MHTWGRSSVGRARAAYAQLDTIDSDARYHAALLEVHTGNVAESRALADTILASDPGHLFGYVVRGTVARFRKDEKEPSRAYGGFLKRYDPEMKLIGRNTANIKPR